MGLKHTCRLKRNSTIWDGVFFNKILFKVYIYTIPSAFSAQRKSQNFSSSLTDSSFAQNRNFFSLQIANLPSWLMGWSFWPCFWKVVCPNFHPCDIMMDHAKFSLYFLKTYWVVFYTHIWFYSVHVQWWAMSSSRCSYFFFEILVLLLHKVSGLYSVLE